MYTHSRFVLALLTTALLLGSTPPVAQAQSFRWATSYSFNFQFNPNFLTSTVAACPDGGAWWVRLDEFHFNYGSASFGALALTRYSPAGVAQPSVRIGGSVTTMRLLAGPAGGAYLLGVFRDSLRLDAGHQLTVAGGNVTGFVAALDAAGQCRWLHEVVPPTGSGSTFAGASALAVAPGGELLLGVEAGLHSYIQSLDPSTGAILTSVPQLNVQSISSVAADAAGNLFVAGGCAAPSSRFNGQPYPTPPGQNYSTYVACYDPARGPRWVHYIEDITCSAPQVAPDGQGGLYFAGVLYDAFAFGTLTAAGPPPGMSSGDFYLAHLNAVTGTFEWLREVPQVYTGSAELAERQNLAVDDQGRAYVAGTCRGTIPWDSVTTTVTASFSRRELLTLCYEPTGSLAWAKTSTASTGGTQGLALSVATVSPTQVSILLAGRSSPPFQAANSVQLDTLTLSGAVGEQLPFIARLDAPARPLGVAVASPTPPAVGIFPNPVAPGARVQLGGTSLTEATLFDALGRLVARYPLTGRAAADIPAPASAGFYLLRLRDATGPRTAQRLVVK